MGDRDIVKLGPAGPMNGQVWDEKGRTAIQQIILTYSETTVHSIQFVYYQDEKIILSDLFGSNYRLRSEVVKLDCPEEYIKGVSGICNDDCLKSIKFQTNIRTYGPFGQTALFSGDSKYNLSIGKGHFGEFHGFQNLSSGTGTGTGSVSIGMYMKLPIVMDLEDYCDMLLEKRFEDRWGF